MSNSNKRLKYAKHHAETVYVGEYIDLKKVQEGIRHYVYLNRDHPLVIRVLKEQYVVLTKFGAVTFWNVSQRLRKEFLKEIIPFVKNKKTNYPYDEETKVFIGGEVEKITFDTVYLTKLEPSEIKIISYVLSQSVALERYEDELEDRFDILDEKIKYLSDISQMLMNFLAEKRNAFLETIIILLFVVDLGLWFLPPFPEVLTYIRSLF